MATLRIEPAGREVECHAGESILEAALGAGLAVAYGCSNGNCGSCRARLARGALAPLRHSDFSFSAAERDAGWFLMCTHALAGDAVIEAGLAGAGEEIPVQHIEVRVKKAEAIDADTFRLQVQTPRTSRLRFLAGQDASLEGPGGGCLLAIASCPCDDRNIEFHVPLDRTLCADPERLAALRHGDRLTLTGPFGGFVLDRDSTRPRLMIGEGPGLAPLKSIIEHSLSLAPELPVHLVLLEPPQRPHYLVNLMRSWRDAFDAFTFETVAGEPREDELRRRLTAAQGGPAGCDCYLAGSAAMVRRAVAALCEAGVDPQRIRSRVFSNSGGDS